jgi:hypothetical protein
VVDAALLRSIIPIERCLAVFLDYKMRKTTLAILFFVVMICANCTWRTLPVQAGSESSDKPEENTIILRLRDEFSFEEKLEEGRAAYERGDYATALKKWRPLAEAGNADAQTYLGVMYANGRGVPQDDKEAAKWFRLAAEQGLADAQNNLGVMYAKGQGVPQDYKETAKWYRKAAEQGNAIAQDALGDMYEKGQGVPQNKIVAYALYNLAAANDASNEVAKKATSHRNTLLDKMTPREIEVGQALSRELAKPGNFGKLIDSIKTFKGPT